MNTLTQQAEKVLRQRAKIQIEVQYIPTEYKPVRSYCYQGIRNVGIGRILGRWAEPPTYGVKFGSFGILEDL